MENKHNIEASYRILFLQACDFYKKRNNNKGLEIEFIHNIDGKKILDKSFNSVLDYSLDLIKLDEISKQKKDEEVFDKYRTDIINVAFDYQSTTKLNLYELREWAYKEGLVLNGRKYVRYKRSSGSSREGQCLFILEELYKKMDKWSSCGINPKSKAVKENIVSWEAYRALSLSEIKNIININPEHILVLKDYEHVFYSNGIQVTINDKKYVDVVVDEKGVVYRNGVLFVKTENTYYMIDIEGNRIGKEEFKNAKLFGDKTYAAVEGEKGWYFIDNTGKQVFKDKYFQDARSFVNGYAAVKQDGYWGFIDMEGNIVIECTFDDAKDFNGSGSVLIKQEDAWRLLKLYSGNYDI